MGEVYVQHEMHELEGLLVEDQLNLSKWNDNCKIRGLLE